MFYAALDVRTAFWETQPQTGDYITLSEWKIKEDEKIFMHSIFHPEIAIANKDSQHSFNAYIDSKKQIKPDLAQTFEEILKFYCEEFMKPVNDKEKNNYLFSALMSSRLLQGEPDTNGFRLEAISYPSIKKDYGLTNIAILNSLVMKKLDLVSITVLDVRETNYDPNNKDRDDIIKVSPLQVVIKDFDFENDKIKYNGEEELRMAIELHEKYGRSKNVSNESKS